MGPRPRAGGAGEAKPLGEGGVGCSTFSPLMSLEGAPLGTSFSQEIAEHPTHLG